MQIKPGCDLYTVYPLRTNNFKHPRTLFPPRLHPSPLFMSWHSTSCQLMTYNFPHVRKSPIFPSGSRFSFSQIMFSPQPVHAPPEQKKVSDLICVSIFISLTKYTCSFSKLFNAFTGDIYFGEINWSASNESYMRHTSFWRCCEHNYEGGKFIARGDNSGGGEIKGRKYLREKIIRERGVWGGSYCMRNAVG